MTRRFGFAASAIAIAFAGAPAACLADVLIDNANGIQVDTSGRIERFSGVIIGRDGRVLKLVKEGDPQPDAIDDRFDVHGQTMLPGLIDAHGHLMELGLGALQLDLTGTRSLTELQRRLAAYAAANPNLPWIIGRGWNQELWSEKRFPAAADLDAVVSDRPVWLSRVDGHAAVGNSAALREAGISADTKAPAGGRIENGLFTDAARDLVEPKIPAPSATQRDTALLKAQETLISYGVTAMADMGTTAEDWETMRTAGDSGRLHVRVMSYALGVDTLLSIAGERPTAWLYAGRLKMGGVKLYADGALGSRGAWLKQPYADRASTRGLPLLEGAKLRKFAGRAAMNGFQVAVHAIGDAANAEVIAAYEELGRTYPGDRRWRIEHAQVVDPADIPRIAKAGIIASMQPTHQTSDMNMAGARLGEARLAGAYAWRTISNSGVHLAFGSDFPVESSNPFPGLSAAITRSDPEGQPPGGWRPEEAVSLERALAGFTREAAYAGFVEGEIGSLDPGAWADFILIDRDPTKVDGVALAATRVTETWMAGRRVWQRPPAGTPATVK